MAETLFDNIKSYLRWSAADERRLAGVRDRLAPHFPQVLDAFYERILSHPETAAVLREGSAPVEQLRVTLKRWLGELFAGKYDADYYQRRSEIGRAHVRVGLPYHYMFAAMSVLRQALTDRIERLGIEDAKDVCRSLHKLLDLELAIMTATYWESYAALARDREREAMNARLKEAEQLATIGQLAASLAHEIKNPLAGISGAVQVIARSLEPSNPHRAVLDEILKQVDRLDAAVKDLLIYARPTPPRFRHCRLGPLILQAIELMQQEPDVHRIDLRYEGAPNGPTVRADEHQIQQLISNLVLNAAQACRDDGEITIRVEHRECTARLVVKDNGHGMSPEALRRAFEPFYTTRARGTGLGLPICKKIVEAHGGAITIDSLPERGATVTVLLPLSQPAGPAEQDRPGEEHLS